VSFHDAVVDVLVAAGVAGELLCCAGLVVARDVFDRLHFAMASTTVPPFLIAAAVIVEEGWTQPGIKALLVAAVLLLLNPVLAHATARAARMRRFGQIEATDAERRRQ
jgi:monovalent cation/proton antiporter MnhG/PhaG subunit